MVSVGHRPLSLRWVDAIYVVYFLIHIPATFFLDFQIIFPEAYAPAWLQALPASYVKYSNDPVTAGALGYTSKSPSEFAWLHSFLWLEVLFQFPMFFFGAYGLYKDSLSVYVPIVVYGASTATATLGCFALFLATPETSASTIAQGFASFTSAERMSLLGNYLPFLLVPLVMALDFGWRLHKLAVKEARAEKAARAR